MARGLGVIESSGVHLTPEYISALTPKRIRPAPQQVYDDPRARCGEVLTGAYVPHQCPLFKTCNPETAFGALMVSSEGACAARYQYRQQECSLNNIQLAAPRQRRRPKHKQLINSLLRKISPVLWLAEQEDQARLELAQLDGGGTVWRFSTDSYM